MSIRARFAVKPFVVAACTTGTMLAFCLAAAAAPQRYVSSTGNDANNCNSADPCRTLQRAVDVSVPGSMVIVLDSSSYGASLTITKAIAIVADGVTATLSIPGNITINAAGAVVSLRGLALKGRGGGVVGITILDAAAVHIERCVIDSFPKDGIHAAAVGAELFVLDSISRNNGVNGFILDVAGGSRVTIENSRFENNAGNGVFIDSTGTVSRSIASGNGSGGIGVGSSGNVSVTSTVTAQNGDHGLFVANPGTLNVESSVAHGNGSSGLFVATGATARISNSTFTGNVTGINNNNVGTVETRRNNTVRGNTTNVDGPLTPIGGV